MTFIFFLKKEVNDLKKKIMIVLLGSLLSFNTIQANESLIEEPTPDTLVEIPDYETPAGFPVSEDASMIDDNVGYGNLVINKQLITHIWHTECDVMGNQAWVPDIDNPTGDRSREGHRLDHCGQPGNWIIYLDENGTPYMLEERNAGGANGGTLTARFYSDGTYTQEIGIDDINLNERIYFTTENDYQGRHQVWHHSGITYPENPTFKFYIGDGVYELHAGETLTLENLPAGTYQIVEEYNPEFYPSTVSVGFELDENSNVIATATVNSDQTTEVDFVNERITERPEPTPTPIPPVESEPESVPESIPESIPESVPESIPESVPESVPDPIESEPESIPDPVESEPEVPHDIINNIDNSITTNTTTTNTDNSVTNTTTTNNTDNSVTNTTTTNNTDNSVTNNTTTNNTDNSVTNNTTTTTTTNNTDNSITNNTTTTTTTNTNNTDNSVTNTTTTTNTNTNNSTTYTDIFDLDNSMTTTTNNDVDVSNVLSYNETNIQKSNSSSSNVRIDKSTTEISTDNSKVVKKDEFISEDNDITNNHSNTSIYSPSTATITTNNYQRPNTQAIITPSNQSYKNTSTTTITTPTYNTTAPKETVTNNNNGKYQVEPVKTGDKSPIIVLIIACILSLGVILYIVFGKKEI